jgi:hypothetical protein
MEVIWSARAKFTYFKILDYLEKNWTKKEIIQFSQRSLLVIQSIKKNQGMFPCSVKYEKIRKAFIDKNNSLFYFVDLHNDKIWLLTFFDNRQNPDKLKID